MNDKKAPLYKTLFFWFINKKVYPVLISLIGLIGSILSLKYACLIWGIISILSTYFGLFLWYVFRLHEKEKELINLSYKNTQDIAKDVNGYFNGNAQTIKNYFNSINDSVHNYFKDATIIYKTNICSYDQKHINILQQIIKQLNINGKQHPHIYAIDYSSPLEWWNESMTAYLAICSHWQNKINAQSPKSDDTYSLLSRFFIYDDMDLSNPLTTRTIFLHSQLGFNTYVFSFKSFIKLFNTYKEKNNIENISPKEMLLFENSTSKIKVDLIDGSSYKNVLGYQSYWNIDKGREGMKVIKQKLELAKSNNIDGKVRVTNIQGNPIDTDVLFEILDYESLKTTPHSNTTSIYLKFIKEILLDPDNLIPVSQTGNVDDISIKAKKVKFFGLHFNMDEPKNDVIDTLLKRYLEIQYEYEI